MNCRFYSFAPEKGIMTILPLLATGGFIEHHRRNSSGGGERVAFFNSTVKC